MQRYAVVEKAVGETPLEAIRIYKKAHTEAAKLPVAYAGRLDPMASGKLLLLIGDECKKQEKYHGLDKAYRFEVLLGTESDSGDVLGIVDWKKSDLIDKKRLSGAAKSLVGEVSLPYPRFSSKTVGGKPPHQSSNSQGRAERNSKIGVGGKPLFVWALEGRLSEIEIPIANTKVYRLKLLDIRIESAEDVYRETSEKIETIPEVTEESKRLGADFRRRDVRLSWQVWRENHKNQNCQIATFECVVSSGTYIRSLAPEIARRVGTVGLAYSIHRTEIGRYLGFGFWSKKYR